MCSIYENNYFLGTISLISVESIKLKPLNHEEYTPDHVVALVGFIIDVNDVNVNQTNIAV